MFIAVNFQSICYLMDKAGYSIVLSPNFLSEEERHESEESSDSEFEKKTLEFLHFNSDNLLLVNDASAFLRPSKIKFSSSNFSGTIYTPPEFLFI